MDSIIAENLRTEQTIFSNSTRIMKALFALAFTEKISIGLWKLRQIDSLSVKMRLTDF